MSYQQFDVVVPFPFTDRPVTKKRLARVISDPGNFGDRIGHAVLAMITSAKNSPWPSDVAISDLAAAKLPAPSKVRMKLFTLDHLADPGSARTVERNRRTRGEGGLGSIAELAAIGYQEHPTNAFKWHALVSRAIIINIMPKLVTQTEIQLDPQGRVVIPAPLRRSLGFKPGDHLIARMEEGRLILEKNETIKQRLKNRFVHLPPTTHLAEELIAERREEAKREASE